MLTHSKVQGILWKAASHSACQTLACFLYGTRRFITVLTKASRIQFAPLIPMSLRSIRSFFKDSVRVRGALKHFVTSQIFFTVTDCQLHIQPPKLEDHLLSAVCNCLFDTFAATLHILRSSLPSATWGRAMPWWQGTHLTWKQLMLLSVM
jgi:hypothetical protein